MQISVVIPTYNRVQELKECLDSIFIQTLLPKEILVVDNSGRDRNKVKKITEGLKSSFRGKHVSLRYIRNQNLKRERLIESLIRSYGVKANSNFLEHLESSSSLSDFLIRLGMSEIQIRAFLSRFTGLAMRDYQTFKMKYVDNLPLVLRRSPSKK